MNWSFLTAVRLAVALWHFWYVRGYYSEGRHWLELALERNQTASPSVRASALSSAANIARTQGDHVVARRLLEESLAIFRELDDVPFRDEVWRPFLRDNAARVLGIGG